MTEWYQPSERQALHWHHTCCARAQVTPREVIGPGVCEHRVLTILYGVMVTEFDDGPRFPAAS